MLSDEEINAFEEMLLKRGKGFLLAILQAVGNLYLWISL